MSQDHIIILSSGSVSDHFLKYFSDFDIEIHQIDSLDKLVFNENTLAVLIHWLAVKDHLIQNMETLKIQSLPIMIFHDKRDEFVCIQALSAGADDFLTIPLNPREIYARIKAIQRRIKASGLSTKKTKELLNFDKFYLDLQAHQLLTETQEEIKLSPGEYLILTTLISRAQQIISREELMQLSNASADYNPLDRRIDVQVSRLRQKIEADPQNPLLIKTIRNKGYLFTAEVKKIK